MPVDSVHPDFASASDAWLRARDVLGGEASVKVAGERYVPKLELQTNDEYDAYVARGSFYNATARTLSGYLGMLFRKPPAFNQPKDSTKKIFDSFRDDVDLFGTTLASYSRNLASEVLAVGRGGTLVDWHDDGIEQRAFLAFYSAENIRNWRVARVRGRVQPVLIVLQEFVGDPEADEFEQEKIPQLLVLRLTETKLSDSSAVARPPAPTETRWVYTVEKWQQRNVQGGEGTAPEWVLMDARTPLRRGAALSAIPFTFHGPTHSRADVERSPIDDIVTTNLGHFRLDVDYKHGLHFTALPTAWVSGFEKNTVLKIGGTSAWVTETIGATAGFLEFKGQGLETFERAMDRLERLLTVLGSRLLESQKRVSESAEALSIRQSGESSILADLSVSLSASLTDVLRWVYWWHSPAAAEPGDISEETICLKLNTDFETALLTGKEIEALVGAWQAGAISRDTMLFQWKQGELLPPGRTQEQELALIKADPPPVPVLLPNVARLPAGGNGNANAGAA